MTDLHKIIRKQNLQKLGRRQSKLLRSDRFGTRSRFSKLCKYKVTALCHSPQSVRNYVIVIDR